MWLFTAEGFFSITESTEPAYPSPEFLQVRARTRGDLWRLVGRDHELLATPDRDYPWRIYLDRETVARLICESVLSIDYVNFKAELATLERAPGGTDRAGRLPIAYAIHAAAAKLDECVGGRREAWVRDEHERRAARTR